MPRAGEMSLVIFWVHVVLSCFVVARVKTLSHKCCACVSSPGSLSMKGDKKAT